VVVVGGSVVVVGGSLVVVGVSVVVGAWLVAGAAVVGVPGAVVGPGPEVLAGPSGGSVTEDGSDRRRVVVTRPDAAVLAPGTAVVPTPEVAEEAGTGEPVRARVIAGADVDDDTRAAATGGAAATTPVWAARADAAMPTIIPSYAHALAAPTARRWERAGWNRRGRALREGRTGLTDSSFDASYARVEPFDPPVRVR
jgi:hypothetical protein